jgi:hypothetical protein
MNRCLLAQVEPYSRAASMALFLLGFAFLLASGRKVPESRLNLEFSRNDAKRVRMEPGLARSNHLAA